MNKKQAFIAALRFQPVFPVPFVVRFTVEAEERYTQYKQGRFDPVKDTGSYAVFSQTNHGWKEVAPGYFRDYFGVVWNKTKDRTLGIADNPPIRKPTFRNFRFPSTNSLPVYAFQMENNRNYPDHFHILSIGFTLFERAWSLVGMENLMTWMLLEPEFVHDLMGKITEYNVNLIRQSAAIGGIDCVRFGDDWAGQHGLLFGKDLWLEFIRPYLARMCLAARNENLWVAQHCCGKVDELIPEMIESGIHLFDPFQPEVMKVFEIFRKYYGRISFMGGLSIQHTMPLGSPEDVMKESKQLISILGEKGGYIFSPSHALTKDIPPRNIETMLNIAIHQDQYLVNHHGKGYLI
jgi:uroporphyrinogen decarboxylase